MGVPEEPEHPAVRCGSGQALEEAQRCDGSLDAVARRTAALGHPRRDYRKLRHKNISRESRHGPRTLPQAIPPERKRSRTYLEPDPETAVSHQDARTGQSCQPHRGPEELLALHERSLRQPEAQGSLRELRLREGTRSTGSRATMIAPLILVVILGLLEPGFTFLLRRFQRQVCLQPFLQPWLPLLVAVVATALVIAVNSLVQSICQGDRLSPNDKSQFRSDQ